MSLQVVLLILQLKANKKLKKIFGNLDCEFIGFDSFKGFGNIKDEDQNPSFQNKTFYVDENKVLKKYKEKMAKGKKIQIN